jgi:hypothetical protein
MTDSEFLIRLACGTKHNQDFVQTHCFNAAAAMVRFKTITKAQRRWARDVTHAYLKHAFSPAQFLATTTAWANMPPADRFEPHLRAVERGELTPMDVDLLVDASVRRMLKKLVDAATKHAPVPGKGFESDVVYVACEPGHLTRHMCSAVHARSHRALRDYYAEREANRQRMLRDARATYAGRQELRRYRLCHEIQKALYAWGLPVPLTLEAHIMEYTGDEGATTGFRVALGGRSTTLELVYDLRMAPVLYGRAEHINERTAHIQLDWKRLLVLERSDRHMGSTRTVVHAHVLDLETAKPPTRYELCVWTPAVPVKLPNGYGIAR